MRTQKFDLTYIPRSTIVERNDPGVSSYQIFHLAKLRLTDRFSIEGFRRIAQHYPRYTDDLSRPSTMTEAMYRVYTAHGGHKKKHPLDEVQGL